MSHADELQREVDTLRRELAACRDARQEAAREHASVIRTALSTAAEVILDPVFLHDPEGRVTCANRGYLDLVGLESAQVLGRPYWELFPCGDGPTPGCRKALVEPGVQEEEFGAEDGRVLRMRSFAVRNSGGHHCSLHLLLDVTEQKRFEESLLHANEELQRFAFVASHDLKAPLRAVHGLSTWIEEEVAAHLSDQGRERLRLLRERVQLMDELINGMLDYSRAGAQAACIEEVSTRELAQEVIATHGIPEGFHVTVAPDLPTLRTDHLHLQQVFANLLGNAIDHHHRHDGQVRVSADDDGDFYTFTVADDGPGIPPEHQARIFDMFQRGAARRPGTGIGLAVVRRAVERAGGRIQLESAPGRGSVFRFTWPKTMPEA